MRRIPAISNWQLAQTKIGLLQQTELSSEQLKVFQSFYVALNSVQKTRQVV